MSLGQAISAALSGLRIAQTGVTLVADNIANADTPGYIRKTLVQASAASSGGANGVRLVGINRELDMFVQRQLRAELAGAGYVRSIADFHSRIELIYGQPGNLNALDALFNSFTNTLQALVTSPESISTRSQVLNEASVLAQHLNSMSNDIQELRIQAEQSIAAAVTRVNEILAQLEQISPQIRTAVANSPELAGLLDTRDSLVFELSSLIDVRVTERDDRQVTIMTNSGVMLFDHQAVRLRFDGRDNLDARSLWSADPAKRLVGTIRVTSPTGYEVDLVADRAIRSGTIAAYLDMRDRILVQAQAQLDEIAHSLALALSSRTVTGTAAASGAQSGFEIDLSSLQNGNSITLTYTDNGSGQQRRVTIVRVEDPGALPLANTHTADPNDTVIGVSFATGVADAATALNAALAATGLAFDSPAAGVLRVLDDGAPNLVDVNGLEATVTATTFASGDPSLPFFIDGGTAQPYTNIATGIGAQKLGFAARIKVNPALIADPSQLVLYGPGTDAGDPLRPEHLLNQLVSAGRLFSAETGLGTTGAPYSGTLADFIRQTVSMQGAAAENAKRLNEGQAIVVEALQSRFTERSGVNIDAEMANLLLLQTAYGASARVLNAVREMMELLMRI